MRPGALPLAPLLGWLAACAAPAPPASAPSPDLALVESYPNETALGHEDLPDTAEAWLAMLSSATRSIDVAQFYVSDAPGSRLHEVLEALEAAARRGVRVRILAEEKFHATYPETLDRWAQLPGFEVRRIDSAKLRGGVHHAKYLVVDGEEVFVGSQNFDWRSLDHIAEIGLRLRAPGAARAFEAVFEADWACAGGDAKKPAWDGAGASEAATGARVTALFSPRGWVPEEAWDLPRLVSAIDGARRDVRLQTLTYRTDPKDPFELEAALVRAAARGVSVRVLAANWSKRRASLESLERLRAAGASVRFTNIPEASSGFIPFARVAHAKFLVVDGADAWVGTANAERDYFFASRNAGLWIEGGAIPRRLAALFDQWWEGPYAEALEPGRRYEPPRIGS